MRYLRLIFYFIRYALVGAMEFRVNFLAWSLTSLMWAVIFVVTTDLIFGQVSSVAGWSKNGALMVAATLVLFNGVMWIFILPSLDQFSSLIRKGDLDGYLSKPVNSRFFVSMKKFEFDQILRLILISVFLIYLINSSGITLSVQSLTGFVIMFVSGQIIFYNIFFTLTITNFWLVNVHNLDDMFHELMDAGRYPVQVYKGIFAVIFSYIIPVGFVGTFPVQALLGTLTVGHYVTAAGLIIITSLFSHWFWNFALKHYSSASS